MKIHAWLSSFAVRLKKTERELIIVLRAQDDELAAKDLKETCNSVSKEGTRCDFVFEEMIEDKSQPKDRVQLTGLVRSVRVASTTDGRFVEMRLAVPEIEVTGADYETLAAGIRGSQEPSFEVWIENLALRQVVAFESEAVNAN